MAIRRPGPTYVLETHKKCSWRSRLHHRLPSPCLHPRRHPAAQALVGQHLSWQLARVPGRTPSSAPKRCAPSCGPEQPPSGAPGQPRSLRCAAPSSNNRHGDSPELLVIRSSLTSVPPSLGPSQAAKSRPEFSNRRGCRGSPDSGYQTLRVLVLQRRDPFCRSSRSGFAPLPQDRAGMPATPRFLTCTLRNAELRQVTVQSYPLPHEQAAPPLLFLHGDDAHHRTRCSLGVRCVVLLTLTGGNNLASWLRDLSARASCRMTVHFGCCFRKRNTRLRLRRNATEPSARVSTSLCQVDSANLFRSLSRCCGLTVPTRCRRGGGPSNFKGREQTLDDAVFFG